MLAKFLKKKRQKPNKKHKDNKNITAPEDFYNPSQTGSELLEIIDVCDYNLVFEVPLAK